MVQLTAMILTGVITSFYFFPFEFTFLPGINTKMAMAGLGLFILSYQLAKKQNANLDRNMFKLSAYALLVSFASFVAITYNNTRDYTYVSYIISMWVWLSGAYVAVTCMRKVHGIVSVEIVANYLIAVCFVQCILALMIEHIPVFKGFVDTFVSSMGFVDLSTMGKAGRLYGIGAGLDVAGSRFTAVLLMIAYIVANFDKTASRKYLVLYILAFISITFVGNMISRTTIIGTGIAIIYWLLVSVYKNDKSSKRMWKWLISIIGFILPIIILLYYTNHDMAQNIRFAFEGFFSLVEKGSWDVQSNDALKEMVVFPDNLKTWIIGDGYMLDPSQYDEYYVGPVWHGFYRGTDIGYLRFLFYFGILGLAAFCYFILCVGVTCMRNFDRQKFFFVLLLLVNYIVWFKVSTDIFLVFALFLCVNKEENDEYYEQIALKEE